jgi:hypothetical protein
MKDFEKNIQTKADAFRMDPLPDSFDKVMEALEKKKKRRFIFWLWFLIPGLAIGGSIGIYEIFSGTSKPILAYEQKQEVINNNEKIDQNISSPTDPKKKTNTTLKENTSTTNIVEHEQTLNNTIDKKGSFQKNRITSETANRNNSINNTTIEDQVITSHHQTEKHHDLITSNENHTTDSKNGVNSFREKETLIINPNMNFVSMFATSHSFSSFKKQFIPKVQTSPLVYIKPKFSKFSLGIYSDLGVSKSSFYTTVPSDSTAKGSYTSARSSADKFLFSYSAGLQFRYSPIRCFGIETGVGFTHYESYQVIANGGTSPGSIMDQNEPDTVLSFDSFNGPSLKEYYNTYDYISIPVKIYYQNKWKWVGIEAGGGVIFDIPVNTKSYAADENTGESYLKKDLGGSRLNKFGIQAVGNLNVVFHIGNFSLFAGPTFKYRLNSMFDDHYIMQQRPYFIGVQIGVRYNF